MVKIYYEADIDDFNFVVVIKQNSVRIAIIVVENVKRGSIIVRVENDEKLYIIIGVKKNFQVSKNLIVDPNKDINLVKIQKDFRVDIRFIVFQNLAQEIFSLEVLFVGIVLVVIIENVVKENRARKVVWKIRNAILRVHIIIEESSKVVNIPVLRLVLDLL